MPRSNVILGGLHDFFGDHEGTLRASEGPASKAVRELKAIEFVLTAPAFGGRDVAPHQEQST
ncbi:hypothetical protein [Azospirillum ramasamyi]|uniref:Uncharacterized protein n=1 Tax=Azospirillum ramasamyi TaxID=682998 RepID=A0A2U9S7Y0_9PROT|nr:hypothetical protein [Azospirillum ramasamyi]AWU95650.1 hypothetical protein DM194_15245 [Azospirillum ramasamyi]